MSSSRRRSETLIKPGSESSFDADEITPKYNEAEVKYVFSFKLINAIRVAISLTILINIVYFTYILKGCGLRLLDFLITFLVFTSGVLAAFFMVITTQLRSPLSIRPFMLYHASSLLIVLIIAVVYILYVLNTEYVIRILSKIQHISSLISNILTYDFTGRFLLGFLLFASIAAHSLCLHVSFTYYASLNCFLKLHTSNVTFV